jgi:hypothetical protein
MPFHTGPFITVGAGAPLAFGAADLVRSTTSHTSGSWYFEMVINYALDITKTGVGIDDNTESTTLAAGRAGSIIWLGNGIVNYNGTLNAYRASPFNNGDVLGVYPQIGSNLIGFRVNGGSFTTVSIAAITGPSLYALAQLASDYDQVTANFTGVSPAFAFSAPATAWG